MQVEVQVKEGLKRSVKVVVPAAQIETAVDKKLGEMQGKVKLKGFRAGKVPKAEVARRYGVSVRQEVIGQVMQQSFYDALQQEKLQVVGTPKITPSQALAGQPLEYVAEVEVLPEFEPKDLAGVEINRFKATLTDSDIDEGLENLRKQHSEWFDVDRESASGDQVIIDYKGMMDGKVFDGGSANDVPLVIGSKQMIPGFEDGLIGFKEGGKTTLKLTFPEKYKEDLAGKPVQFDITFKKVKEPRLPGLDDKLAEKFAIKEGGLKALREEVRKNLQRTLEQAIKMKTRRQVIESLIELNDIDTPESLVENEISRMKHEVARQYSRGSKEDAEKIVSQMPSENFEAQALMNVKTGLIFGELIRRNDMKVDPDRVKEYINNLAISYQNPDQVVQWYYNNKKQLNEVERIVLEEQVIDEAMKAANIKEEEASYSELVSQQEAN